jgi:hypothetical protein
MNVLADSQPWVTYAARWGRVAFEFRRLEYAPIEVDRLIGVADDEIRTYGRTARRPTASYSDCDAVDPLALHRMTLR